MLTTVENEDFGNLIGYGLEQGMGSLSGAPGHCPIIPKGLPSLLLAAVWMCSPNSCIGSLIPSAAVLGGEPNGRCKGRALVNGLMLLSQEHNIIEQVPVVWFLGFVSSVYAHLPFRLSAFLP